MTLAMRDLENREEGRKEGKQEGLALMSALINKLIGLGRADEIPRVTTDEKYRDKLISELAIR